MPPPLQSVRQRVVVQLRVQTLSFLHVAAQRDSRLQSRPQVELPAEQSTVQFAWSVQARVQRAPLPQVIRQVAEPEQAMLQLPVVQVNEQLCRLLQEHLEPHAVAPASPALLSGTPASGVEDPASAGGAVASNDGATTGASLGMFQS
jgi:hypothetical protein